MQHFCESVLGFRLHSQLLYREPTIVFLAICDRETALARGGHPEMLVLIDPARHPGTLGRFDGLGSRQSTLNHLAFEIDESDDDAACRQLKEQGRPFTTETLPVLQAKAVFFEDPEGNLLELICNDGRDGSNGNT